MNFNRMASGDRAEIKITKIQDSEYQVQRTWRVFIVSVCLFVTLLAVGAFTEEIATADTDLLQYCISKNIEDC